MAESRLRAKRAKLTQQTAGLKTELHFRELELDPVQWPPNAEADKLSAHADSAHNLYVSDTSRIIRFSPDGSHKLISDALEPHHIVPNSSTDHVVLLRKT